MEKELRQLVRPVARELGQFQRELRKVLRSNVQLINTIIEYVLDQKSKRMRPILTLLSAKVCGVPTPESIVSACLVEVLHTATLVHDDVVDEAKVRRGEPAVNAVWDNKISVLFGDFLFSKSLNSMLTLRNFEALELLSQTSELLSSGEILQLEKSFTNGMNENVYFDMIWAKTASLFATACKVGGITAGGSRAQVEALYRYGKYLGMAFQIKDDLFDYTAAEDTVGKPLGRDLKSNLLTLPMIYALNQLDPRQRTQVREQLKNGLDASGLENMYRLTRETGGQEYARNRLDEMSEHALDSLASFPASASKESLEGIIRFNRNRSH